MDRPIVLIVELALRTQVDNIHRIMSIKRYQVRYIK